MKIIRVHWSLIREDIIEIFQDTSILKFTLNAIIINKHGIEEAQDRATGSYRKCFHCFGKIVINHTCERVPYITHDFHRKMWEAVRWILVEGYNDC